MDGAPNPRRQWKTAVTIVLGALTAAWVVKRWSRTPKREPSEPDQEAAQIDIALLCAWAELVPEAVCFETAWTARSAVAFGLVMSPGKQSPRELAFSIPPQLVTAPVEAPVAAVAEAVADAVKTVVAASEAPAGEAKEPMSGQATIVPAQVLPVGSGIGRVRRACHYSLELLDRAVNLALAPFMRRRGWAIAGALALAALSMNPRVQSLARAAAAQASEPMHRRAAFIWEEPFEAGLGSWTQASSLARGEAGVVRVRGVAVHNKTAGLGGYDAEFSVRPEKKSIGWVVGGGDPQNHVAFKLVERGRSSEGTRYELARYTVVRGHAASSAPAPPVTVLIAGAAQAFLNVTVRVSGEQIATMVNGFGVDVCKRPETLLRTELAFVADNGESFLLRSLTISGNDDFLGVLLRGTENAFQAVYRGFTSRERARALQTVAANS